jgi:hypothetical protein
MSTKSTLKSEWDQTTGQGFQLYEEMFDEENVYLELQGFTFEAANSTSLRDDGPNRIAIRLPNAWARKLGLLERNDDLH